PDAHGLSLGAVGVTGTEAANRIAAASDLVIALGTRLSDFTTASKTLFQAEGVRFLAINLNAMDAHKQGSLPLIADARAALSALSGALSGYSAASAYRLEVASAREGWLATRREIVQTRPGPLIQAQAIGILNEETDSRSTIVHAAGGLPGDLHKLW